MSETTSKHATLDAWIRSEAVPFSLEATEGFNAAVDGLIGSLSESVELLGFGEGLHGGEEILELRNRLFQRLVEAHGYRSIAIESSFPRGRAVDAYVSGRGAAAYEEVQDAGFGHGFGRLDANRELVEWMRRYNADPAHGVPVRFYGFDMPGVEGGPASPREVLGFALDYLAGMDAGRAAMHRERIEPHLGEDARWEDPMAWRDAARAAELMAAASALRIETEELISTLRTRRPEWVEAGGAERYGEALQYARVGRQLLTFFAALSGDADYAASLAVRDALMADNLAYIVGRERGRGKVLVFAHNAHLQRGKTTVALGPQVCSWWPAGAHVGADLGERYAVIGTAVGVSEENGIGAPEEGTLEGRLTSVPGPGRFFPTHRGAGLPAEEAAGLSVRSGSVRNPSYVPLTPRSLVDFDALAVLDGVTYYRGGRPLA